MAINSQTREIEQGKFDSIEAFTGKKVRGWRRCMDKFAIKILFEDETVGELAEGEAIEHIRFIEHHNFCISCGENHGAGYFDYAGRCFNTLNKIWGNARKVYWHRYIKNNHKLPN